MSKQIKTDFTTVTELPGGGATGEQLSMAVTRYNLAAELGKNKSILELASGPGIGFGIMAKQATKVVGVDIDPLQIKMGNEYYKGRFQLIEASAEKLPFDTASFDVILILEAIYYIENLQDFIEEVKRVLKPNGRFLISYPNKEWGNFNPSPYTYKYFSISEMHEFLTSNGFSSKSLLGFQHRTDTFKAKVIDMIRTIAVKFRLIPKSFAIKDILKRIFLGKLKPIPSELEIIDGDIKPLVLFEENLKDYKSYRVVYTIGTVN
jgi:ubiquinone/menaquinone biosynthesis C-methylase UbiE